MRLVKLTPTIDEVSSTDPRIEYIDDQRDSTPNNFLSLSVGKESVQINDY